MTETQTTTAPTYTDEQATDEAVLLMVRKLMRLHPAAYADVMAKMPEGAREALSLAERRADVQRSNDELAGIPIGTREWPTEAIEDEEDED